MRYCDGEPGEYDDGEFDHVRGDLYVHSKGTRPLHYNDGALVDDGTVVGPDAAEVGADRERDE